MNHKLFALLLSKRLYPILRAEGFRGSGNTLRRVVEPVVQVFNVQASSGGRRCYLNLGLHLDFLLPEGGQLARLGELSESQCAFRERIDPPPGQSFGWHYGLSEEEAEANVDLVIQEWERQAAPFFSSHAYPAGLAVMVEEASPATVHPRHLLTFARIALQLGRGERAVLLCRSALERVAPDATGLKHEIARFLELAEATWRIASSTGAQGDPWI